MILQDINYCEQNFDVSFDSAGNPDRILMDVRLCSFAFKEDFIDVTDFVSDRALRFFESYYQNRAEQKRLEAAERAVDEWQIRKPAGVA